MSVLGAWSALDAIAVVGEAFTALDAIAAVGQAFVVGLGWGEAGINRGGGGRRAHSAIPGRHAQHPISNC